MTTHARLAIGAALTAASMSLGAPAAVALADPNPVVTNGSGGGNSRHVVSRITHTVHPVSGFRDRVSTISRNGELNNIQLQSLVSQRQQAVQLTARLMQTMNETTKNVVGNICSTCIR